MSNLFLKPCLIDGAPAVVRDPHTLVPLAAGGENKADNDYWRRRLRDGDVVEANPAVESFLAPLPAGISDTPEARAALDRALAGTPTPDPSPQGGGERTELAAEDSSVTRKNARSRS